jgi:hypothetical protein
MRLRPRHALLLTALLSVSVPGLKAHAQEVVTQQIIARSSPPGSAEHPGRRSAVEHFADANTTHDGRLTLDQATAGYKSIAKSFAQIDVNHHGYVTIDDIKAWKAAKKAAKLSAKHADEETAGGMPRPIPAIHRGAGPKATNTSTDSSIPDRVEAPRAGSGLPAAPVDGGRSS